MVRVFNRQFFQSSVFFRSLFCLVSDLSNIVLQDLDYASMYDPRTCYRMHHGAKPPSIFQMSI